MLSVPDGDGGATCPRSHAASPHLSPDGALCVSRRGRPGNAATRSWRRPASGRHRPPLSRAPLAASNATAAAPCIPWHPFTPATATLLASAGAAGARAVGVGGAHRRAPAHPPRQAAGAAEPRARPRAPTLRRGVSLVSTNQKLTRAQPLRPAPRTGAAKTRKTAQKGSAAREVAPLSISHEKKSRGQGHLLPLL